MKFGHFIQTQRTADGKFDELSFLVDLFWVDYKGLKKTIKGENPRESFALEWEKQLANLANALRESFFAVLNAKNDDLDDALREYMMLQREALRKSAKKYDKKIALPGGYPPCEPLFTRLIDTILETTKLASKIRATPPPPSQRQTGIRGWVRSNWKICVACLFTFIVASEPLVYKKVNTFFDSKQPVGLREPLIIIMSSAIASVIGALYVLVTDTAAFTKCFEPKSLVKMAPAGIALGLGDLTALIAIEFVDPTTFSVMAQSRLIITALLSYCLLPSHPNILQWFALGFVALGILVFCFDKPSKDNTEKKMATGILILMGSALTKGFASSWMDRTMKKRAETDNCSFVPSVVHLSVANAIPAILFLIGYAISGAGVNGAAYMIYPALFLFVKNWYSLFVVKTTSAIVKYLMCAVAIMLTYCGEMLWFDETFRTVTFLACLVVCLAVVLFATGKEYEKDPFKKDELTLMFLN